MPNFVYSALIQSMMDTCTNLDIDYISHSVYCKNGQFFASSNDYYLYTAIQPIFSLAHKRIVGYEALVRVKNSDAQWISPIELFNPERSPVDIIFLDRLCRYVHIHNFINLKDNVNWLFLNISPQTIINGKSYGSFFDDLLEKLKFPSHRIIIEIVEHPILSNDLLLETVNYYKSIGCLIAIDDFGAGHSNFDRVWTLNPDIVKLDRSMLLRTSKQNKIRQLLPGIVSLLHQAGSLVLIEGVETEKQAMIALESDADFVQGYFFARPTTDLSHIVDTAPPFKKLFENYKKGSTIQEKKIEETYNRYHKLFQLAVDQIKKGTSLIDACKDLLADESVVRCYLLMPNGIQIGHTVVSEFYVNKTDIRFKPLEDAKSADWFRRHYLQQAIVHPNQLQITRPYLSITGAHMCITLSMMLSTASGHRVLCCDLNFE